MKLYIPVIIVSLLLSSCDRYLLVTGTVLDAQTKAPVEDVSVDVSRLSSAEIEYREVTDKYGHFRLSVITGPLHPFRYIFTKDGYQTIRIKAPGDTIYIGLLH